MIRTLLPRLLSVLIAPSGFLFVETGGGAAPGGGGGAAAGSPGGGSAPAATPSSPTSPEASAAASAPTGAAPAWTPPKDKAAYDAALEAARTEGRRGFVPGHRLTEETTKRQQYERDLATAQQRIRALSGIETLTPDQAEAQKVREAFLVMFPEFRGLMSLTPERLAALERALESGTNAADVVKHHWDNHANRVYSSLASEIESTLGIERMSDRQFSGMVTAFRGWSRDRVAADPNGFRQRYEAADPTLLAEFVKEFTEDWIAPSRRQAVATVVNRPRVPAGGRTPAITTPAPNLDNIKDPEGAEDVGIQYMRDRGVQFRG